MVLKITDLKKHLKDYTQEDLLKEIVFLTKQFPNVKEYYNMKLNPESELEVFKKYQKIIYNEFSLESYNCKMRYSIVNKAISDFKRAMSNVNLIAELMLYYVQVGLEFISARGDMNDRFYDAILRAFMNALDYIEKNDILDYCREPVKIIMDKIPEIGWGFPDNMQEIYYQYYDDEDEVIILRH